MAEDEGDEHVVEQSDGGGGADRLPCSPVENQRTGDHRDSAECELPGDERGCRQLRRVALHQHGADRPGECGADHQQCSDRRRAHNRELAADQQQHAAHAERHPGNAARGELFVQHEDRQHHHPQRHGVGEDCTAPRGQQGQTVTDQDVPHRDVEERGQHQARPLPFRHAHRKPAGSRDREQADGSGHEAGGTECPHRQVRQRELHHRPVQPPAQREQGEDRPHRAGEGLHGQNQG